jgi:hypothetical protein
MTSEVAEAARAAVAVLLENHLAIAQSIIHAKLPNLPIPRIMADCSQERFNEFQTERRNFKNASTIPEDKLTTYLMSACADDLKDDIQRANRKITDNTEAEVMVEIKRNALINKTNCTQVSELLQTRQEDGKGVRRYAPKIAALSRNCSLEV